jgi:nicotinamidase-related amidase
MIRATGSGGAAAQGTDRAALIVVDVQQAFDDPTWGARNNPTADAHIAALVDAFADSEHALVYVRHDGLNPNGRLHPSKPGNSLKSYLRGDPDLTVSKHVNSAFHGQPDLNAWLTQRTITEVLICGITTNHCCETTARIAGNLGFRTSFILDATYTFDRVGPDGRTLTADQLARATATNLHGEFATVVSTTEVLTSLL